MKKQLSSILALSITASALSAFPANAALPPLVSNDFESSAEGFTARGSASVRLTSDAALSGSQSAAVTGRTAAWNGIAYTISSDRCSAGDKILFRASVMQKTESTPVKFKFTMEYGGGFGGSTYDTFAEAEVSANKWTEISETYQLKEGTNPVFYIETDSSSCDFYVDDILIASTEGDLPPLPSILKGDVNNDKKVDVSDVEALRDFLIAKHDDIQEQNADLDQNKRINAADLTLLKRMLLDPNYQVTTTTTTTAPDPGQHTAPKEYMTKVKAQMTQNVPGSVTQGDRGKQEKIRYYSKVASHEKNAIVWLPPGYDASKQYPVMYMNHGIFGDETSMLNGFSVPEMASNLIQSGDAVPFIIVFTQMYSGTDGERPGFGINMQTMDNYDKFLDDMTDSLMPYIQEHYPVKTGRDNTAIAGFSMGGRETLYLTICRPDLFGYAAASSPAPGIVPASDLYLSNHLGSYIPGTQNRMKPSDFKIADDKLPYLLMIAGGTNDGTVGTFPKEYHELFAQNGTEHIWTEVPGGGHDGSVGTPLFYNFFRAVFKA